MLKKMMIGAAVAALIASPALAQSFDPSVGSGNVVGPYNSPQSGPSMPEYGRSGKLMNGGKSGGNVFAFAPRHHRHMQ